MKFKLNDTKRSAIWQQTMLEPLFEEVASAFDSGNPVAIHAQIWNDREKFGFIEAMVLDVETCNAIQKVIGVKVSKAASSKSVSVWVPIEESEV